MSARRAADPDDLTARFVEDLAMVLADAGMPRMSARVYAYLVVHDSRPLTAGELADGLRVSPAAVSGAVRHLIRFGSVDKGREPGAAADSYCLRDDATAILAQQATAAAGRIAALVGDGVRGMERSGRRPGRRLVEVQEYTRFWADELPGLMERWDRRRRAIHITVDE